MAKAVLPPPDSLERVAYALEECAHEWLCVDFDWPEDVSAWLVLEQARYFPVGAIMEFDGDGFYEVFAQERNEVRVVTCDPHFRRRVVQRDVKARAT